MAGQIDKPKFEIPTHKATPTAIAVGVFIDSKTVKERNYFPIALQISSTHSSSPKAPLSRARL